MSLKKRMFRSNMAILFLALLSLLVIMMVVLVTFEDSIEENFLTVEQSRLDRQAMEVFSLADQTDFEGIGDLSRRAGELGYQTVVVKDGTVLTEEAGEDLADLAKQIGEEGKPDGKPAIYYYHNATIVAKYFPEEGTLFMAMDSPEQNWLFSSIQEAFQVLMTVLLFISAGAIVVLLLLSSFFTRRMARIVMEPLEKLVAGARRIQEGNLKESIGYQGDEEFEYVCRAFDSMQATILEDQRQREKAEQARRDMVTGISHDLRTPLTSILGYLQLLEDESLSPEERRQYLSIIEGRAKTLQSLITAFYDLSRIEGGEYPLERERVDLYRVLSELIAEFYNDFERSGFAVEVDLKEGLPPVWADSGAVLRIFTNLVGNALKHGKTFLTIRLYRAGDKLVTEFSNDGTGLTQEDVAHMFERFYTADKTRSGQNTGLGMSIVQALARQMGHDTQAELKEDVFTARVLWSLE